MNSRLRKTIAAAIAVMTLAAWGILLIGAAADAAMAQDGSGLVSLSASHIIALLEKEPGLLLEVKKALVKAASDEGRLLEASDLTDDAVYDLIREDETVRALVTREIEERHYVQPKPRHDELEHGMVVEKERPTQEKETAPSGSEPKSAANQEDAYWENHAVASEQHREKVPGAASEGAERPAGDQGNRENGNLGRSSARANGIAVEGLGGAGLTSAGGAKGETLEMPKLQPDELPGLLNASLPPNAGRSGASPTSGTAGLEPETAATAEPEEWPIVDLVDGGKQTQAAGGTRPLMTAVQQAESQALQQQAPQHRANPYNDVPSLYDLYSQYSSASPELARFGEDIFRNGTGNFADLPMDLPVGPEYVVGPGDGLNIELYGGVSERLQRVVDRTGRVGLPEVGAIEVSGRNLGEVQQAVQHLLRTQFRDVQADVTLSRLRSVRVYVVGDVERPGAYDVSSLSTPLNALYQAGGPTARGSLRILRHYRGQKLIEEMDVYDLLLRGVRKGVQGLEPGDTVLVPTIGPSVAVEGMVRRPAIYELNGEKNLAQILELAGGVLRSATLRQVDVERVVAHEKRTMLRLDLPVGDNPQAVLTALEDFAIEDGDRIKISPILPYADQAVYLTGHVVRPGRFAYREGMKLTDIIHSYKDLMPEPYGRHAEIVRLRAPDFTPAILAFNLDEALGGKEDGKQDIALQPFDTIRIFSRFDFEDPPTIQINGEVRFPGKHLTRGALRLRDAVYLAGGLTRDAELGDAQVFRRLGNGKLDVLSVNLERALAGEERDNILLEPKDQLLIHKNPMRADPPAVKIAGEIERPGKYPLGESMTVADLVRVAGGLKRGASTETADLTRYESTPVASLAGAQILSARIATEQIVGQEVTVALGRALAGEAAADLRLHDGDVLTVREIAGWKDMGATITVEGEVASPGTYGIQQGERLSSILARAGGFRADAYPYGAVFERVEVREMEQKNRARLLTELEEEGGALKSAEADGDDKPVKDAAILQWKATVDKIENTPPGGRMVIHIAKERKHWANTSADVEVRAGDRIFIPKRPGEIMVDGAVLHATAVAFRPGRNAGWYLRQAGGASNSANRKEIFVIRADGSVASGPGGMFGGGVEGVPMLAGDMVMVPEKAFRGTTRWKAIFQASQIAQAVAIGATVGKTF